MNQSTLLNLMMIIIANWLAVEPIPASCYEFGADDVIRLYSTIDRPAECQPEGHGDLNFDGTANFRDLAQLMTAYPFRERVDIRFTDFHYYIAEYWLVSDVPEGRLVNDIDANGRITFIDFAEWSK